MKKYHIELGEEELRLISRALDLYSRMGMYQFNYLTDCTSIQKALWKGDNVEEKAKRSETFRKHADNLKWVFGYAPNSNPGIFNSEVGDDCRIAADIHQTIRHQFYLDREGEKLGYTVDAYPASICDIAKMKLPTIKFIKDDKQPRVDKASIKV